MGMLNKKVLSKIGVFSLASTLIANQGAVAFATSDNSTNKFTITYNAGHAVSEPGTSYGNLEEHLVCLDIAEGLKLALDQFSIKNATANDSGNNINERVIFANTMKSLNIEIHNNTVVDTTANGFEIFVENKSNPQLIASLDKFGESYSKAMGFKYRGIKCDSEAYLKKLEATYINKDSAGILLEVGFLSNSNDYSKLDSKEKRVLAGYTIGCTLLSAFNVISEEDANTALSNFKTSQSSNSVSEANALKPTSETTVNTSNDPFYDSSYSENFKKKLDALKDTSVDEIIQKMNKKSTEFDSAVAKLRRTIDNNYSNLDTHQNSTSNIDPTINESIKGLEVSAINSNAIDKLDLSETEKEALIVNTDSNIDDTIKNIEASAIEIDALGKLDLSETEKEALIVNTDSNIDDTIKNIEASAIEIDALGKLDLPEVENKPSNDIAPEETSDKSQDSSINNNSSNSLESNKATESTNTLQSSNNSVLDESLKESIQGLEKSAENINITDEIKDITEPTANTTISSENNSSQETSSGTVNLETLESKTTTKSVSDSEEFVESKVKEIKDKFKETQNSNQIINNSSPSFKDESEDDNTDDSDDKE